MILRKNYDKPNRCSAWSGPGMGTTYPWEKLRADCESGNSGYYDDGIGRGYRAAGWAVHTCKTCGTKTLPWNTRWIDPLYLAGKLTKWRIS